MITLKIDRFSNLNKQEIARKLVKITLQNKINNLDISKLKDLLSQQMEVGATMNIDNQAIISKKAAYTRNSIDEDKLNDFLKTCGKTLEDFKTKTTEVKATIEVKIEQIKEV